jgi:hypothetical protein
MVVALVWTALLVAALAWECWCRLARPRWLGVTEVCVATARHPVGRLLLIAVWAFVGLHVFARYTLPA